MKEQIELFGETKQFLSFQETLYLHKIQNDIILRNYINLINIGFGFNKVKDSDDTQSKEVLL